MKAGREGRAVVAWAAGSWVIALFGVAFVACFDLFHSTADILTACEIDATTRGCAEAGGPATPPDGSKLPEAGPGTDICQPRDIALGYAHHACAWLGACETPMGGNAFGACMFQALQAYDCAANPSHRVQGPALAFWDCLSMDHGSCKDVDRCVFGGARPGHCEAGTSSSCIAGQGPYVDAGVGIRMACPEVDAAPAGGENCALAGKTCDVDRDSGATACTGPAGFQCNGFPACNFDRNPDHLRSCDNGQDRGVDCTWISRSYDRKEAACQGFPTPDNVGWVACLPASDGGSCALDANATCDDGVATTCLTGSLEHIDCNVLLQADSGCHEGTSDPPDFDWTLPCKVDPPDCDADQCTEGGSGLIGCFRGSAIPLPSCAEAGLGPCEMSTVNGAACTSPGSAGATPDAASD